MPAKEYCVDLPAQERDTLVGIIRAGKAGARQVTRARISLKADEGWSDEEIAEEVTTSVVTGERTRRRFVEEDLGAVTERPRTGAPPRLTGKAAAHLSALTCSPAPNGRERWTWRLLATEAVEVGLADTLSHDTVRQLRNKTNSSRGSTSKGVSPASGPSLSRSWQPSSTSTPSPMLPSGRKSPALRPVTS
jgi:putative transposase